MTRFYHSDTGCDNYRLLKAFNARAFEHSSQVQSDSFNKRNTAKLEEKCRSDPNNFALIGGFCFFHRHVL